MPFCPKCKIQYRDGFSMCSDCKIPLVESLSDVIDTNFEEEIEEVVEDDTIEIDAEKMKKLIENPPTEDEIKEMKQYIEKQQRSAMKKQDFLTTKEKAKELKSTGIMLIIMGVLGASLIALIMLGVIPYFRVTGVVKWTIYSLFELFFLSFIYFGINSLVSMKKLDNQVNAEEDMNAQFKDWFKENITKEAVDAKLPISADENTNYFMRNEMIKRMVFHVYPNMENNFVEAYIDEHYEDIFG